MKQNSYKKAVLVLLFAIVVVAYLAACKKKVVEPIAHAVTPTEYQGYTDDVKKIVGKIKTFKKQMTDRECVMRSNEHMPLDSVVWNVEALFNATYTFPERKYVETVKQNLSFFVNINEKGEVPLSEVYDLYEDVTEAVRQAYASDGITDGKSLMAVIVSEGEIVGTRAEIDVLVVSGRTVSENASISQGGPFGEGDCWYYGEYGGTCSDPSVFGDAAEAIEDSINYHYGGSSVPQQGLRAINFSMVRINLEGNEYLDENGEPYIFYFNVDENPGLFLSYNTLNHYYWGEVEVILNIAPTDLMNENILPIMPVFLSVDIEGLLHNGYYCHKNHIIYCSSAMIPVQELGPAINIL